MIALHHDSELDRDQRAVLDYPAGDAALAVTGLPGSGKTHVVVLRAQRLALEKRRPLLTSAAGSAVERLRGRAGEGIACASLGEFAFGLLRDAREASGDTRRLELVDDARAAQLFEPAGAALFALDWTEFAAAELDPEITGLRSPERFAANAYRLIRKLRASLVSPEDFRTLGMRGAAEFYARPPNFASAALIGDTPAKYRDSLRVDGIELERQRARELDLVKILARLYATYAQNASDNGALTEIDAVYEATMLLRHSSSARELAQRRADAVLVDDAHDLTDGGVALLRAAFGQAMPGVTFAGDPRQRVRGFAGGARLSAFAAAATTIELRGDHRPSPAATWAARAILREDALPAKLPPAPELAKVEVYRADTQRDEARYVASEVARALASGIPPQRIAVVVRNAACAHPYVDALLARDLPVDVAGAANLYEFPAVLDALAALWAAIDPYRHDYLIRNLEAPWLALSDASIAVLCADAEEPQPLLVELPEDAEDEDVTPRWDRRRDLRLGRNLTRGDADKHLSADARERIAAFRAARARWEVASRSLDVPALARLVLGETALGGSAHTARARFDAALVRRLLREIDAFAEREPLATLDAFLAEVENRKEAEGDLLTIARHDAGAVIVCDAESLASTEFDIVCIAGAGAGTWPRYYVPDAFLFTPKFGMIPKDNVGDVRAARTAKFTWAFSKLKFRSLYNEEDRRAFYLAATRSSGRLVVTAYGRATKGTNTPEFCSELQAQHPLINR